MKRIFIVGGDGFARECYTYIQDNICRGDNIFFGGFIGHNGYRVNFGLLDNYFIGDLASIEFDKNDWCVIGAGYPELRKIIYYDLKKKEAQLYNLITGDSRIPDLVDIGEGNVIVTSFFSPFVKIGNGNNFNFQIGIGHDVEIGDFNFFGPRTQLLGNVKVGDSNKVATGSILLPKSKIGSNNIVAPLSVIYKGCKNNCYMSGNPALKVGTVQDN